MPLVAIDRSANLCDGIGMIEFSDTPKVANQVIGRDFKSRVVTPLIWIPDLWSELLQLLEGLLLSCIRHPREFKNA